ncbi:MAG: hypothetical protein U1C96_11855 [Gallionella sp.]|nr:hypothetical protein [Gallionella sp.]
MQSFRIFLSSPGDCADERSACHEVASRLNSDPLVSSFTRIEVVAWDWGTGIPLEALASPQESVNIHLELPEDCEVFVGIFCCRLGTPLPTSEFRKIDGSPYLSGSEYEFHRAWDARRRGASSPAILIYRRNIPEDSPCEDIEQHQKLQAFFDQPPLKEHGQWTGSVNGYSDSADFTAQLEGHLRTMLCQYQPGAEQPFESWLNSRAAILTKNAGPRYTGDAHMESDIGEVFDWLLTRQAAVKNMDEALADVWKEIDRDAAFVGERKEMERIAESLRNDVHWQQSPDFDFILGMLKGIEGKAWGELEIHDKAREQDNKIDEHGYRSHHLRQAAINANSASDLLERYAKMAHKRVLLLTGPAGQGKTHTVVHEINRTLEAGGIAIGVLGQTLGSSGDLWSAIRAKLEWQGTTDQLLDKLENEAANKKQRALLVIDALNETPSRNRWRTELLGMLHEIVRRPHLVLVISVRSDYLKHVLPEVVGDEAPWVKWGHPGFMGIEPDALMRYFEFFGVKAPIAPPLGEFSNPLYVQLLAKSLKGRQFHHWLPSWLEVWEAWIDHLEREALDKAVLSDASRNSPVRRTMNKLAQSMLDDGLFALPRHRADDIARQTAGSESIISFLCSSGALIDRLDGDDDVVEFGFERLSDTFLADRLLANLFNGLNSKEEKRAVLSAALASDGALFSLVSPEWMDHPLYYRRSGLLEALCLAVPSQVGVEFPALVPQNSDDEVFPFWELDNAFTDSLRWRSKPEEFGAGPDSLYKLWEERNRSNELDELIRFALIPGHPFAMEHVIHPWLLEQESPGARDAIWSVEIAPMWPDETSTLGQLVKWARDAQLQGIHEEVALPAAQLLAWTCATSNNPLRHAAIKGLTRLLVAGPVMLKKFLPDYLIVNDPYILEGVLVAVWGVTLDGRNPEAAGWAAQQVYDSQFPDGNARWCHITLRHYARRIVEEAQRRGWLPNVDLSVVRPLYRSQLALDQVPSSKDLEALDGSGGFNRILSVARGWGDFYWYIMGGNSASLDFSSTPLPGSSEVVRPFRKSDPILSARPLKEVFDLALSGQFVAWHCRSLGWTAERFNDFDTGHYTREHGRSDGEVRTERIGKKYQWISWHTLLAFLSDNYAMQPDWNREPRSYDTPDQVGVHLHDPARWLQVVATKNKSDAKFWNVPNLSPWSLPDMDDMKMWINSTSCDLPPADVVAYATNLPEEWGRGTWLRIASEHIWESGFAPGQWGLGNKFHADLWWQITPLLIHASDLPKLLQKIERPDMQSRMAGSGRVDAANDWHIPIAQWPNLEAEWDDGFCEPDSDSRRIWLPVPWRELVGKCGHPDRRDDHAPIAIPLPSLFREWGLELDLHRGVVHRQGQVLFGLSGWVHGEDVLFARLEGLHQLLAESGYTLVWWLRGERRAFMNISDPHSNSVWADYNGLAYLGGNGQVQTIWMNKKVQD